MAKRFLAVLIDAIAISVVAILVGILTSSGTLRFLVNAALFLTRDALPMLDGQSIGKRVMKIKAVRLDDSPLTGDFKTSVTRNILFVIPVVGLVECIIFLTRNGGPQAGTRLGDDWAKTKVISVD